MIFVRDIYDWLDRLTPFDTQLEIDNSGLQTGDLSQRVTRAMVCLDVTPETVSQAAAAGCELLVAHHPVLFNARKMILCGDPAWQLARHNISCIASHTPLDICTGGVNDVLARLLNLGETTQLDKLIRLITLPKPLTAKELAQAVASRLQAQVRYNDAGKVIKTVAVCGGAGCHFMEDVYGQADAFLTGDAGHHDFLDAAQHGLALVAAGHFETEHPMIPVLTDMLRADFPTVAWHIAQEAGICHAV